MDIRVYIMELLKCSIILCFSGTYKLIKRDLQMEGFDINKINDTVYFMDKGCYIPLSEELCKNIVSGKVRL